MIEPVSPGVRYRFHELTRDYALEPGQQASTRIRPTAGPGASAPTGRC